LGKETQVAGLKRSPSASWLNQVEIWFGILSRKASTGANFPGRENLIEALQDFNVSLQSKRGPVRLEKTGGQGCPAQKYNYKLMHLKTSILYQ
jgi:hypothetical protein